MISATDSFLTYLSAELAGDPVVHWVHATSDDIDSNLPKHDALNVSILGIRQEGTRELVLVSLDLIGTDERQVMGWVRRVADVLDQQQYTPEQVFTPNPNAPTATGRLVAWDSDDARFDLVKAEQRYVHLNATFEVWHSRF